MNNIKVSIIVPVYNIPENILRQCIESTLNQTLKEIEVILVDDGSTDNSGLICDEYKTKDNRVKVIHKKNAGLSAARNTGYEAATGDWITFLDSDDWIDAHTCENTYKMGVENSVDVVIFGTIQEFEHYKNPFKYHYKNGTLFKADECKKLQCEILDFTGNIATAWAKLFNRKFLNDNQLKHNAELRQGSEGIEFNIRVFEKIERAYFTDDIYYHYIYNPNSISAKHDEKNHYYVIKCFEEIKRQIKISKNNIELSKEFFNRLAYVLVATAISGYFSPDNRERFWEKRKAFLRYINQSLVKECLNSFDWKSLDIPRVLIIYMIKLHLFFSISILAKIRYQKKHGRIRHE